MVLGSQTNGDAISVLVLTILTVATCANHISPDNTRYQLITILRPTLQARIGRVGTCTGLELYSWQYVADKHGGVAFVKEFYMDEYSLA